MTRTRHQPGSSRAGSVRPVSTARDILKQRDKPYRTEKGAVLTTKKKKDFSTASAKPPSGYTFVAYGTPLLADRCKELSKEQHQPVYIVNAKPFTRHAKNPDKLSYHVHRIGYHFKAEIVEDACAELSYTFQNGHFVHWNDVQKQAGRSRAEAFMTSRGLTFNTEKEPPKESEEQVRATMKELFPKMPQYDMEAIFKHAWADGSLRVGTNQTMDLSRRVQLATLARIRHTYTDYDFLLKAFGDWEATRAEVEPICLVKLKEWRGDNAQDEAEEREWVQRDFIVIEDEDEDRRNNGHEADDEDSAADIGYESDTSLEITHVQARDEDLGAESANEASQRYTDRFQRRYYQPQPEFHRLPPPQQTIAYNQPLSYGAPTPQTLEPYRDYHSNFPNSASTHQHAPQHTEYRDTFYRQEAAPLPQPPPPYQQYANPYRPDYQAQQPVQHSPYQPQNFSYEPRERVPLQPAPPQPEEMIVDGVLFRKVVPSIEAGGVHHFPAAQPPVVQPQPRSFYYVEPGIEDERRYLPPPPVHGAPAPVQQMPREYYLQ